MPISLRRVKASDILKLQNANLHCLAENYPLWYWMLHYFSCPQVSHISINKNGKCLGYVLGKMDTDARSEPPHGQITSVATFSQFRKLGIATKLMKYTHKSLRDNFNAEYVNLHMRETNRAAAALYRGTLGYQFVKCEKSYYSDGENAYSLRYFYPGVISTVKKKEKK